MKGNRRNNPPPPTAAAAAVAATNGATAALPSPTSPSSKGTAKYTNKDGSKFITVPKVASPVMAGSPAPPFSPTRPPAAENNMSAPIDNDAAAAAPTGNRKKAKRRAKAAARVKAEEESNAAAATATPPVAPHRQGQNGVYSIQLGDNLSTVAAKHSTSREATAVDSGDDEANSNDPAISGQPQEGAASKSKKSKKKKKKKNNAAGGGDGAAAPNHSAPQPQQAYRPPANATSNTVKEKIWNTNSQEERQRIKEFWLDLSEDERKSLVKVEKDTVLKKMKEQQKMTCSCHFCGRKRTAIEEELEGLYDSYYEELEHYANDPAGQQHHQQQRPAALLPSSNSTSRFGLHGSHGSHHHGRGHAHSYAQHHYSQAHPSSAPGGSHQPSRGRIVEHAGEDDDEDDDELDEEYGDDDEEEEDDEEEVDDEEDDLSDEDGEEEEDIPPEEIHRDYANDFFNFGNSLQVHGGILTVADDLLKNDGRKFIEMMEQLAERRMAREEDAKDQYGGPGGRGYQGATGMNGAPYGHNHHIPSEEEDYGPDDEEEEDYGSDDEYDEEEDTMTEEQRMEEGRRMFQIFAARMFEQRVLTAYREKVSKERQQRLFDELDEEKDRQQKREEKRAKDAQKRKDKAAQKKKALADEKARKEAEKLAEQEARRAETAQRAEEQKRKAEEKRKKREAQRKAEEEERLRKEAARQARINEQKNLEQKAREAKERDKRLKEEARQRDKEEQEKRERESRERKEKQERDKRDKEARARANEAKERQRQEERAAQKAAPAGARATVPVPAVPAVPVPAVPAVPTVATIASTSATASASITLPKRPAQNQQQTQPAQQPPAIPALPQQLPQASPQPVVATPVSLQKAPTPMRPRQLSQQGGANSAGSVAGSSSRAASLSGSGPSQSQNQSQTASPNTMTPAQSTASFGSSVANKASTGLLGGIFGHGSSAAPGAPNFFQPTSPLTGAARPVSQQQQQFMGGNGPPGSPTVLPFQLGSQPPVSMPPGFGQPGGPMGFRSVTGPPGMLPILSSSSSSSSAMNSIGRGNNGYGMVPPPPPGFGGLAGMGPNDALVTPIGSLPHDGSGMGGGQHSRQASGGGFDPGSSPNGNGQGGSGLASMPMGRPAPIGRPGSTVHGQRPSAIGSPSVGSSALGQDSNNADDDLLGSRALLDDSEFAMDGFSSMRRQGFPGHGAGATGVAAPPPPDLSSPFMSPSSVWAPLPPQHHHQSPLHHAPGTGSLGLHQHPGQLPHPLALGGNAFPPPQSAFGPPPGMTAPPGMGPPGMPPPGMSVPGWGLAMPGGGANGNAGGNGPLSFASPSASLGRTTQGRSVTLRQLLCRACKELAADVEAEAGAESNDDPTTRMVPIAAVKERVAALADACFVGPVVDGELDLLYDTEGNSKNGGGNFDVKRADADPASFTDSGPVTAIRWVPDAQSLPQRFANGGATGGSNGDSSFGNPFGGFGGIGGGSNHGFGGGGFGGLGGFAGIGSNLGAMGSMGGFGGLNSFGAGDSHSNTAPIGAASSSTAHR
ncbi:Stress response protein nst1 [Sporothrix eucalyptigena]